VKPKNISYPALSADQLTKEVLKRYDRVEHKYATIINNLNATYSRLEARRSIIFSVTIGWVAVCLFTVMCLRSLGIDDMSVAFLTILSILGVIVGFIIENFTSRRALKVCDAIKNNKREAVDALNKLGIQIDHLPQSPVSTETLFNAVNGANEIIVADELRHAICHIQEQIDEPIDIMCNTTKSNGKHQLLVTVFIGCYVYDYYKFDLDDRFDFYRITQNDHIDLSGFDNKIEPFMNITAA
jgi:hypothetical protein